MMGFTFSPGGMCHQQGRQAACSAYVSLQQSHAAESALNMVLPVLRDEVGASMHCALAPSFIECLAGTWLSDFITSCPLMLGFEHAAVTCHTFIHKYRIRMAINAKNNRLYTRPLCF